MNKKASGNISASVEKMYTALSVSLFKLMEEKPFEKISTIDICKSAKVPRATFYNHFEDKFDLLRYILSGLVKNIMKDCSNVSNYPLVLSDRLITLTLAHQKNAKKIVATNSNSIFFNEAKKVISDFLCNAFMHKDMQNKKYSGNYHIIAEFYANAIIYSLRTWIEQGMHSSKDDILHTLHTILIFKE